MPSIKPHIKNKITALVNLYMKKAGIANKDICVTFDPPRKFSETNSLARTTFISPDHIQISISTGIMDILKRKHWTLEYTIAHEVAHIVHFVPLYFARESLKMHLEGGYDVYVAEIIERLGESLANETGGIICGKKE